MGCCPSKETAVGSQPTVDALNDQHIELDVATSGYANDHPSKKSEAFDIRDDQLPTVHGVPQNILMDRGDGKRVESSDHTFETAINRECDPIDDNQVEPKLIISVRPAEDATQEHNNNAERYSLPPTTIASTATNDDTPGNRRSSSLQPLVQLELPSPTQSAPAATPDTGLQSPISPSRRPVNFEDMPINSMYHRIHLVEVEEQEERRREAARRETERQEREMREFKESMLAR